MANKLERLRIGIYGYYTMKPKRLHSLYLSYKDENNKAVKKRIDTLDTDKADSQLAQVKADIKKLKLKKKDSSIDIRTGKATLDQIAEDFFDNRKTSNNKKDKQRYENHIKDTFGSSQINQIDKDKVETWRDALDLGDKTKNDCVAILKMLLPKGHLDSLDKVKVDKNKQKGRVLKDDELETMFEAVQDRPQIALFLHLCYYTGVRPQAILELTPNHFNDDGVEVKAMKGADSYTMPIKDDLFNMIDDWIELHQLDDDDCLFFPMHSMKKSDHMCYATISKITRNIFDPLFNLTRRRKPITDKTKRISIYSLRRTAATNMAKRVSLVAAQKFLNHSDVKTTMKYIGLDHDDMKGAIDAL